MLKYENLCKEFPGGVKAVADFNLEVDKGRIFVLLGANGAGKTTTIMMTLGFIDATSGSIHVNDVDVRKDPIKAKEMIEMGYIPSRKVVDSGHLWWKKTHLEPITFQ